MPSGSGSENAGHDVEQQPAQHRAQKRQRDRAKPDPQHRQPGDRAGLAAKDSPCPAPIDSTPDTGTGVGTAAAGMARISWSPLRVMACAAAWSMMPLRSG